MRYWGEYEDDEHLGYAVEILRNSFEEKLRQLIGEYSHYPRTELVAWIQALDDISAEVKTKYEELAKPTKSPFSKAVKQLEPPEWINFNHQEFPQYFQICILDEQGTVTSWWQRLPEHLRQKLPPPL